MRLFSVCLVAATILWPLATSSAPADFEDDCINDPDNIVPQGQRRIFDTWSYEELFDRRNSLFATLNDDGGSGWIAGSGGSCREQLRICDYTLPTQPQSNWVFTQFINYLEATEVFVNVTYQYISCTRNAARGCTTLHTTAYMYEPEGSGSNSGRTNPANYEHLEELGLEEGEGRGEQLFKFLPSRDAHGFYLGIEDTGTCGSIERITAYYRVIPSRTEDLIGYPEIPLPPMESSDSTTRNATCAADSTGSNLDLTVNSKGIVDGNPSCLCNPGYQFDILAGAAAECTACRPGEYKPFNSNDILCQACPANSVSEEPATDVCTCDVTFARPPNEPNEDCTRPPSSPRLAINSPPTINGTNITVCWLPSNDRGGRDDFHYNIYGLAAGSSHFLKINAEDIPPNVQDLSLENPNQPVCYTLAGLEEQSSFTIVVVASNGAANDQDAFTDVSEVENRFIAFYIATGSSRVCPPIDVAGPPGQITEVYSINGVAVWKPPAVTGGDLTGFHIRLYYYNGGDVVVAEEEDINDPDVKWWLPGEPMPAQRPLFCQVRAVNEMGPGEWSDEVMVVVVNERCEANNGACEQICANTATSVQCSCDTGYELDSDGKSCNDTNECDINDGGCEHNCTNIPGSRVCSCNPGFQLADDGSSCQDINECSVNNGGCLGDLSCSNTPGSFECGCRPGFIQDGTTCTDINECDTDNGGCEQVCTNTPGPRVVCSCNRGFFPAGSACQDIDECNVNNGGCLGDLICSNTPGSFECGCEPGFIQDDTICTDINECDTDNGGCEQVCTNTPGPQVVCSCNRGFFPAGSACQDIDECSVNNGGCLGDLICSNTPGSFECGCQPGFMQDGTTCTDINECDTGNGGCEQVCTNTPGSQNCSCNPGFQLAADGISCEDFDECSVNNGGCPGNLICSNTPGSFECGCEPGFRVDTDGNTCTDLVINIEVDYDPPTDFTPGPNEYRAASGPVTVTCTATGTGTGALSYQWSSTCRSCPFQSATSNSIKRAAVHSGDSGTHTCTATQDGISVSASMDFHIVDAGIQLFRGSPSGSLPNNGLAISDDPSSSFRLRMFCRSDSMSSNVGQFIGLDGTTALTSNSFFAIAHPQPGELTVENIVGSQSPLTASQQGVYTCRIPLQSGQMREINVGIYPSGFNTPPSIASLTSVRDRSDTILTCTSTGSPATKVTWMRDGEAVVIDGSTYKLTQTVTDRAESTYENVLTIRPPANRGTFTCTVANVLESDSMDITI